MANLPEFSYSYDGMQVDLSVIILWLSKAEV